METGSVGLSIFSMGHIPTHQNRPPEPKLVPDLLSLILFLACMFGYVAGEKKYVADSNACPGN